MQELFEPYHHVLGPLVGPGRVIVVCGARLQYAGFQPAARSRTVTDATEEELEASPIAKADEFRLMRDRLERMAETEGRISELIKARHGAFIAWPPEQQDAFKNRNCYLNNSGRGSEMKPSRFGISTRGSV